LVTSARGRYPQTRLSEHRQRNPAAFRHRTKHLQVSLPSSRASLCGTTGDERKELGVGTTVDIWTYRVGFDAEVSARDVVGYGVEAIDGSIGKVDDATDEVGGSYLVVDTGPWIFGRKVMLPAGVIRDVDHEDEKVFVHRTKDQIKASPEFDDSLIRDDEYRGRLGSYYGSGGAGHRDWDDQ
jgi:hypothetical protein